MEPIIDQIVHHLECAVLEDEDNNAFLASALRTAEYLKNRHATITEGDAEELRQQVKRGFWASSLDLSELPETHPMTQAIRLSEQLANFKREIKE